MANRRIPITSLSEEVAKILDGYTETVENNAEEICMETTKECVKDVKANSRKSFGGSGKYAKGWSYKKTSRIGYTIYNKHPGLPHLLEFGHAKVNGGHVSGIPHIAPAEKKAVENFEKTMKERVGNAN